MIQRRANKQEYWEWNMKRDRGAGCGICMVGVWWLGYEVGGTEGMMYRGEWEKVIGEVLHCYAVF